MTGNLHDLARKYGGCGEVLNVDAWTDGDAVPSTAGLCDSPEKHQRHIELSPAEAAVVARFEAAPAAPESFDPIAALRRVEALADEFDMHWAVHSDLRGRVGHEIRAALTGDSR